MFPACSINCVKISIHAPREGGDGGGRGGTHPGPNHFNPRPPRGGRPKKAHYHVLWRYISIHAPREGGRRLKFPLWVPCLQFQSTPPARGATMFLRRGSRHFLISIHAPREGGDTFPGFRTLASSAFQSTPPARGATILWPLCLPVWAFQSTPPARGATCFCAGAPVIF